MARKPFHEHARFMDFSLAVSASLERLADEFDLRFELEQFETEGTANRLADDLAKLLVRMYDSPTANARRIEAEETRRRGRAFALECRVLDNETLHLFAKAGKRGKDQQPGPVAR